MLFVFCHILQVRHTTSDFAVLIAIVICTLVDFLMGINTPKLEVPDKFQVKYVLHCIIVGGLQCST